MAETAETIFTLSDVARVAAKLDALSNVLDEDDRRVLRGIFAAAGASLPAEESEVGGFATGQIGIIIPGGLPRGAGPLVDSFEWGVGRGITVAYKPEKDDG
jgi:hypothetical protein